MSLAEHAHDRRAFRASGQDDGPLDDSDARMDAALDVIDAQTERLEALRREVADAAVLVDAEDVGTAATAFMDALDASYRKRRLREWMVGSGVV